MIVILIWSSILYHLYYHLSSWMSITNTHMVKIFKINLHMFTDHLRWMDPSQGVFYRSTQPAIRAAHSPTNPTRPRALRSHRCFRYLLFLLSLFSCRIARNCDRYSMESALVRAWSEFFWDWNRHGVMGTGKINETPTLSGHSLWPWKCHRKYR